MSLAAKDRSKQAQIHITCTENDFTNAIDAADAYRDPSACETRMYEVTGLALAPGQVRFTFAQIASAVAGASPIPY
jgi:hypothetical protein